jgi:hypothetical protein
MLDYPFHFSGHDRHAPPTSEGRACRVRRLTFDYPSRFSGHDKRAPPIPRSAPTFRRDLLVRSVALHWNIAFVSAGMTSMPLHFARFFCLTCKFEAHERQGD